MFRPKTADRLCGSLLAGAVGDAWGYPVAHQSRAEILREYGPEGICSYELFNGYAQISDDTQMMLFTANGLLFGTTRGRMRGRMAPYSAYLEAAYRDWYKTQQFGGVKPGQAVYCWLYHVDQIRTRRGPNATNMQTLGLPRLGTMEEPVNDAKDCGALVRAVPIGLYFDPQRTSIREIDRTGAESAALTHGNPAGWLPAAALTHMLSRVVFTDLGAASLEPVVEETMRAMAAIFPGYSGGVESLNKALRTAIDLARAETAPEHAMAQLGLAYTACDVLAMAVYACLRWPEDLEQAFIAAVNHDGPSDVVAAVTGSILGAHRGMQCLQPEWLEPLELRGIVEDVAMDLYNDCQMHKDSSLYDDDWNERYILCRY